MNDEPATGEIQGHAYRVQRIRSTTLSFGGGVGK